MNLNELPKWLSTLDEDDVMFIKKFVLASGSLKTMASLYHVTYPTVRLRLDRLIQKMQIGEENDDNYIIKIKQLAAEDEISLNAAKILIDAYRKER